MKELLCNNILVGTPITQLDFDLQSYLLLFHENFAQNIACIPTLYNHNVIHSSDDILADLEKPIEPIPFFSSIDGTSYLPFIRWADLILVLPATTEIISKLANQIVDDLFSAVLLNFHETIVFVPVMDSSMQRNHKLQQDIALLQAQGHIVVPADKHSIIEEPGTEETMYIASPETVLLYLRYARMKQLRGEYWQEAVNERPLTPMERKKRQLLQIQSRG